MKNIFVGNLDFNASEEAVRAATVRKRLAFGLNIDGLNGESNVHTCSCEQ